MTSAVQVFSDDFGDLVEIFDPRAELVVVERPISPEILAFSDFVLRTRLHIEFEAVVDVRSQLELPFAVNDIPGGTEWIEDVRLQLSMYRELLDTERVGVRLATLAAPMCPRFHVDHVPCRLISTYGGPGTEWLADAIVDRSTFEPILGTAPRAVAPFGVALFKGTAWGEGGTSGIVHRSPPTHEPRLLLTLDSVD